MFNDAGEPHSLIEFRFSCSTLKDKDIVTKSDPQVILFLKDLEHSAWIEIGRTEIINDNLNPFFAQAIQTEYFPNAIQHVKFIVIDIDRAGKSYLQQDHLGELETTIGAIMKSQDSTIEEPLTYKGKDVKGAYGKIRVSAEIVVECKQNVLFDIAGKTLDKKDRGKKSDPFLKVLRSRFADSWELIYRTDFIKNNVNPHWDPFEIPLRLFQQGETTRQLLFQVIDWNPSGKEKFIGQFSISFDDLFEKAKARRPIDLINPKYERQKKQGYKSSGTLIFEKAQLVPSHSFMDYVDGGCKISLMVAIDFTTANGNPDLPSSLHHKTNIAQNEYAQAITTFGEILLPYIWENQSKVYGFGARVGNIKTISHCFPLPGHEQALQVEGVQGILEVYYQSLNLIEFHGQTTFCKVIEAAKTEAATSRCDQYDQRYFILLILTAGDISDIHETIAAITEAMAHPISILIVGIGDSNFPALNQINDEWKSPKRNLTSDREMLHFIPFRAYRSQCNSRLKIDSLRKISSELVTYMKKKEITPNLSSAIDSISSSISSFSCSCSTNE